MLDGNSPNISHRRTCQPTLTGWFMNPTPPPLGTDPSNLPHRDHRTNGSGSCSVGRHIRPHCPKSGILKLALPTKSGVESFSRPLNRPSLMSLARKDGTICSDSTLYNHQTFFKR
jgi:hypothetical protein